MRRLMILGTLFMLLVGGCGNDTDNDDPKDPASTPESGLPLSLCDRVSGDDLAKWSGSERELRAPREMHGYTMCGTELGEDGLSIDWRFTELDGSLQDLLKLSAPEGAAPQRVKLPGGTPAYVVTGKGQLGPMTIVALEFEPGAAALVTTSVKPAVGPSGPRAAPAVLTPLAKKVAAAYEPAKGDD